jgi:hypothetical protein
MLDEYNWDTEEKESYVKTAFQVCIFRNSDDEEPFATIPMTAKMPLGAMVFALHYLHITSAGRVDVRYGEEEQSFYNVVMNSTSVKYDRAVLPEE